MPDVNQTALFPMGRIVITRGVLEAIPAEETLIAVFRHSQGDWGDVCDVDRMSNDLALISGGRLFSSHLTDEGVKFWIITEHDRSCTTMFLPEEY